MTSMRNMMKNSLQQCANASQLHRHAIGAAPPNTVICQGTESCQSTASQNKLHVLLRPKP